MLLLLDTKVAVSSKHTTRITSIGKLRRTLHVSRRDEVSFFVYLKTPFAPLRFCEMVWDLTKKAICMQGPSVTMVTHMCVNTVVQLFSLREWNGNLEHTALWLSPTPCIIWSSFSLKVKHSDHRGTTHPCSNGAKPLLFALSLHVSFYQLVWITERINRRGSLSFALWGTYIFNWHA